MPLDRQRDALSNIEGCTPEMRREGARALDLWADESLREEIDAERMAELVWKAMAPLADRGAVGLLRDAYTLNVDRGQWPDAEWYQQVGDLLDALDQAGRQP